MAKWTLVASSSFERSLKKLDRPVAIRVGQALKKLSEADDPRAMGRMLTGTARGKYRMRVGHWRIIYKVHQDKVAVQLIRLGHRSTVYDK